MVRDRDMAYWLLQRLQEVMPAFLPRTAAPDAEAKNPAGGNNK